MTGKFNIFSKKSKENNEQNGYVVNNNPQQPNGSSQPYYPNPNQYQGFSHNNPYNQWQQNQNPNSQWYPNNNYSHNQWQQTPQYNQQQYQQKTFVPCTCPNCGANLTVESGIDTFFCQYCGAKILLQNDKNLKARIRVKKLEHAEKMADKVVGYFDRRREQKAIEEEKKRIEEEKRRKDSNIMALFGVLFFVLVLVGCGFILANSAKESKKQEAELQQMVEQIQTDIKNGDYNSAYVKASSLNYTSGYSSSAKEKWDETRQNLLTLIDQLRNGNNLNDNEVKKTDITDPIETTDATIAPKPTITSIPTQTSNPNKSVIPAVITSVTLGDIKDHQNDKQFLYQLSSEENMGYDAAFRYKKNMHRGGEYEYILIDYDRDVMTSMTVHILPWGEISRCSIHNTLSASGDYTKGWQSRNWVNGDIEYYVWNTPGENGYIQGYNKSENKIRQYDELTYIKSAISDLEECGYSVNSLAPEK